MKHADANKKEKKRAKAKESGSETRNSISTGHHQKRINVLVSIIGIVVSSGGIKWEKKERERSDTLVIDSHILMRDRDTEKEGVLSQEKRTVMMQSYGEKQGLKIFIAI